MSAAPTRAAAVVVTVTAFWLVRGQANPSPQMAEFQLAAGETKEYANALEELFDLSSGGGAITDGPFTVNATVSTTFFGDGATFTAEIPEWNMSEISVTALCATETTGAFIGIGDTPLGPLTITGAREIFYPR